MKPSDIILLQLFFHLVGDYLTQSDWMADGKGKRFYPALIHAVIYTLPFCLILPDNHARQFVLWSHFLIDRYRLARYVVWFKNVLGSPACWKCVFRHNITPQDYEDSTRLRWSNCDVTGYPTEKPPYLAFWLLIIADNTLHLLCNYFAIRFL